MTMMCFTTMITAWVPVPFVRMSEWSRMVLKDGIVLLDGVYNFKWLYDVHMTCSQLLTSSSRITLMTDKCDL